MDRTRTHPEFGCHVKHREYAGPVDEVLECRVAGICRCQRNRQRMVDLSRLIQLVKADVRIAVSERPLGLHELVDNTLLTWPVGRRNAQCLVAVQNARLRIHGLRNGGCEHGGLEWRCDLLRVEYGVKLAANLLTVLDAPPRS